VTRSPFSIRAEDALSWHRITRQTAGIAERSGFRIRARYGQWEVWATDGELTDLKTQESVS
jgi:hypothetical protein